MGWLDWINPVNYVKAGINISTAAAETVINGISEGAMFVDDHTFNVGSKLCSFHPMCHAAQITSELTREETHKADRVENTGDILKRNSLISNVATGMFRSYTHQEAVQQVAGILGGDGLKKGVQNVYEKTEEIIVPESPLDAALFFVPIGPAAKVGSAAGRVVMNGAERAAASAAKRAAANIAKHATTAAVFVAEQEIIKAGAQILDDHDDEASDNAPPPDAYKNYTLAMAKHDKETGDWGVYDPKLALNIYETQLRDDAHNQWLDAWKKGVLAADEAAISEQQGVIAYYDEQINSLTKSEADTTWPGKQKSSPPELAY